MTDVSTGQAVPPNVPAGWYADPGVVAQERYFDGSTWTDQVRPSALSGRTSPPRLSAGANGAATAAFWVGAAQIVTWFLAWPFGAPFAVISMLLGVPTLILGIIGTVRAAKVGKGKANSVTAIVIGALALVLAVIPLARSSGVGAGTIDPTKLDATIVSGIHDQSGQTVTVDCPDGQAMTKGNTFSCVATDAAGQNHVVNVTVQNDQGDVVWQVAP